MVRNREKKQEIGGGEEYTILVFPKNHNDRNIRNK